MDLIIHTMSQPTREFVSPLHQLDAGGRGRGCCRQSLRHDHLDHNRESFPFLNICNIFNIHGPLCDGDHLVSQECYTVSTFSVSLSPP